MDWMATNNSLAKEWSGRKRPGFYTMVGEEGDAIGRWGKPAGTFPQLFAGGVAPEIMILLANMTQTDPWFCMPHRATPEYMTEFARLVKAKLDPKRKVYLEYSNEVWNWGFQQAGWMLQSSWRSRAFRAERMEKGVTSFLYAAVAGRRGDGQPGRGALIVVAGRLKANTGSDVTDWCEWLACNMPGLDIRRTAKGVSCFAPRPTRRYVEDIYRRGRRPAYTPSRLSRYERSVRKDRTLTANNIAAVQVVIWL